jgi:hypothetical protein
VLITLGNHHPFCLRLVCNLLEEKQLLQARKNRMNHKDHADGKDKMFGQCENR